MSEIKINGNNGEFSTYQPVSSSVKDDKSDTASKVMADDKDTKEAKNKEAKDGVIYEQGDKDTKKATYTVGKMSAEERANLVAKLKEENEKRISQLSDLVIQMLARQNSTFKLSEMFSPDKLLNVSAEDIAKAKEDISEDGYFGVKQTSQRMFDFAMALAGDDVDKMKNMQEAMMKGFEQAKKAWGDELPGICNDTIDAANKLFDDYYASKGIA